MSWLKIFAVMVVLKSIFWALLIPLWHTPDEQAHFGHVAYLAEGGDPNRHGKFPDMNEEIYTSLEILGTKRDEQGNNKFTFHPEYRIPYSQSFVGPDEAKINNLPLEARKKMVIIESAYYPHLYYQISAFVYQLFYGSNLFVRVFTVRLFWLWAHLLTIWLSYKIAKIIFPKNSLAAATVAVLTSFQPMFSFVAAGVTSDNLHNLLFTAVIYFSLKIIKKPQLTDFVGLAITFGAGMINKQQFLIAFLIVLPVILYSIFKYPKLTLKLLAIFPLAILVALVLAPNRTWQLLKIFIGGGLPYLSLKPDFDQVLPEYGLIDHFIWTAKHTVREVIPWYLGVFNWLGVVFPITFIRLFNRLILIGGLGILIKLIQLVRLKKFGLQEKMLIFIAWSAMAYFSSLTIWDWTFTKDNGFSFGIQGRYYFPVLVSHMVLLTVGIRELFGLINKKAAQIALVVLAAGFIVLNFIGLYIVAGSYYELTSFNSFIIQASQYKPWFAKDIWLVSVLALYLGAAILFIYKLAKKINEK